MSLIPDEPNVSNEPFEEKTTGIADEVIPALSDEIEQKPLIVAKTGRLLLREFTVEDVPALFKLYQEPSITRFLPESEHMKDMNTEREKMEAYINWVYGFYGYGLWAVCTLDGTLIGRCGITLSEVDGADRFELAYLIGKPFQGQGYAMEASRAAMNYMLEEYEVNEFVSIIDSQNTPSERVAKKLGMQFEKCIEHQGLKQQRVFSVILEP